MSGVKQACLRLGRRSLAGCDARRSEPLAPEDDRVVQIDECCAIVQLEVRQRKWQTTPSKQRGQKPLTAKPRELLDECRESVIREIEATVDVGIVVTPFALVHTRKPEWAIRVRLASTCVPRETSMEDHGAAGRLRERIGSFRPDGTHQFFGAPHANEIDRPPVAQGRVHAEQP
jgi:hypothetical protein